jgi:hypothetical protein
VGVGATAGIAPDARGEIAAMELEARGETAAIEPEGRAPPATDGCGAWAGAGAGAAAGRWGARACAGIGGAAVFALSAAARAASGDTAGADARGAGVGLAAGAATAACTDDLRISAATLAISAADIWLLETAAAGSDEDDSLASIPSRTMIADEQFLQRIFRVFPRTRSSGIEYRVWHDSH